jgi:hypothetical protein
MMGPKGDDRTAQVAQSLDSASTFPSRWEWRPPARWMVLRALGNGRRAKDPKHGSAHGKKRRNAAK